MLALAVLEACAGNDGIDGQTLPDTWFLADPGRSAAFPTRGVGGDPAQAWRVAPGDGFNTSPVVAGLAIFVGGYDGHMYRLDSRTGKTIWRFRAGEEVLGEPSVLNGLLYFGSDDDQVYALDARSGRRRWAFKTGGDIDLATLAVGDAVFAASQDGAIYALTASTGKLRWRFPAGSQFRAPPALVADTLFVGTTGGRVIAVDSATGKLRVESKVPDAVYGIAATRDAVVVASTFVVTEQHNGKPTPRATLTAIDPRTFRKRWQVRIDSTEITGSPAVASGLVYVPTGFFLSGGVTAYELATGKERWSWASGEVRSPPVVARGTVYVAAGYPGNVYGLDAATGREIWVLGVEDSVWQAAAPNDGWLYVVDGGLVGIRG